MKSCKFQFYLKKASMTQRINNAVYRNAAIAVLPRWQLIHVITPQRMTAHNIKQEKFLLC
jgi:hypothetical protein